MKVKLNYVISLLLVGAICGCTSNAAKKTGKNVDNPQNNTNQVYQPNEAELAARAKEQMRLLSRSVDVNLKEGMNALKAKDFKTAEKLLLVARKQMDNYRTQYGRRAMILVNLGSIYEEKEMYAEALPLLNKAQKLFIKQYGTKHPTVTITLCKIGDNLSKQKRFEEASYVYKTAINLMEQGGNTKGDQYKEALDNLLIALKINGQGLQVKKVEAKISKLSSN